MHFNEDSSKVFLIDNETPNYKLFHNWYAEIELFVGDAGFKSLPPGRAYIKWFYIFDQFQSQGYGKKIYSLLEAYLKQQGITEIELNSIETKIGFWKKMGYHITKYVEGTCPYMLKELQS